MSQVTRFGADPLLDQELATKAYVDNNMGTTPRFLMGCSFLNENNNDVRYAGIYGASNDSTNESGRQATINFNFQVNRVTVNLNFNSKDGSTIIAFRDDGVSIGDITILAGISGQADSGALTTDVVSGSLVNFILDFSASTTGVVSFNPLMVECQPN